MSKLGIHMHKYIRRPLVEKNGIGGKRKEGSIRQGLHVYSHLSPTNIRGGPVYEYLCPSFTLV